MSATDTFHNAAQVRIARQADAALQDLAILYRDVPALLARIGRVNIPAHKRNGVANTLREIAAQCQAAAAAVPQP